ncbi:hypothetical protein [Azotobacter beijerinckii]|uniref:hypothetical protein n=1 Tax=Azotobacter beijerinckii TaxID=170623 RepID=UPI0011604362|nr:hypothetical protein [Azotobacter beijerinckii]
MRNDKVQCQCCGKWMVPRPIYGRSFMDALVGWMGTSKVVGNMCPFCLSEDWDGVERVHRGVLFKTVALVISVILTYACLFIYYSPLYLFFSPRPSGKEVTDWLFGICLLGAVYSGYRAYKWLVNTTKLPF